MILITRISAWVAKRLGSILDVRTLMPKELYPEVGTLEDSEESNGPNIFYLRDNWYMSDGLIEGEWWPPLN